MAAESGLRPPTSLCPKIKQSAQPCLQEGCSGGFGATSAELSPEDEWKLPGYVSGPVEMILSEVQASAAVKSLGAHNLSGTPEVSAKVEKWDSVVHRING